VVQEGIEGNFLPHVPHPTSLHPHTPFPGNASLDAGHACTAYGLRLTEGGEVRKVAVTQQIICASQVRSSRIMIDYLEDVVILLTNLAVLLALKT
jgi:hypothetical protein